MIEYSDFKAMADIQKRKLANNTYLEIRDDGGFGIRLHDTQIIIHYPDYFTLDTGGWQTPITKARINEFSRAQVWSDKGVWMIDWHTKTYPYADHMKLHNGGSITGAGKDPKATQKLRKRVNKFAKDYADAFCAGKIPAPSGGDCWPCCMVTKDGKAPMGGPDHILNHLDENYFVPSMLARGGQDGPKYYGYSTGTLSPFAKDYIARTWSPDHEMPKVNTITGIAHDQIRKTIRKFCFRELGLAT